MIGNLSDLQTKIGPIIDTLSLPTNNCASYSPTNVVARIWGKRLFVQGDSVVVELTGDADLWACAENPVPNSRLVWRNDGIFGTPSPTWETWPGDPIKTRLANQPFTASLPASLAVPNDQTVSVQMGNPNVVLGGQFGDVTQGVLRIAGIDISAKAKEALDRAVDPSFLQRGLPNEIRQLNPRIESATFADDAGRVTVQAKMSARIPAADLTHLISMIVNQQVPPPAPGQ